MLENNTIKTICIFGIGGVGGYFGSKIVLGASKTMGESLKTYFIARGNHLDEIRKNGLTLNAYNGEKLIVKPDEARNDMNGIPPPDLVLLCVKGYGLEEAVKQISCNISDDTIVLPLLNGADVYERVRSRLDKGIVLPACVYVSSFVEKPGTVTMNSEGGKIVLGPDPGIKGFDSKALLTLLDNTEINYSWLDDPRYAIWLKYAFITTFALVTAYSGKGLGEVVEDEESRKLADSVLGEVIAVAKKEGIELTKESVLYSAGLGRGSLSKDAKTSFQRDIERKSRRNEGDLLAGTLIRLGKKHGIATPVSEMLYKEIMKKLD